MIDLPKNNFDIPEGSGDPMACYTDLQKLIAAAMGLAILAPARVSPLSRVLQRELKARGWTPYDLARRMGCSTQTVDDLLIGDGLVTDEVAGALAMVFGTSAELWMNLEANYRGSKSDASS